MGDGEGGAGVLFAGGGFFGGMGEGLGGEIFAAEGAEAVGAEGEA